MLQRKIVHIDMDAFYASVEQRDDPQFRGMPVVVAWRGNGSVVCAASYEARKFGVLCAFLSCWTRQRLHEGFPFGRDFRIWRETRDVHQPFCIRDGFFVE
jgi:DNA polymerase IV